MLKRKTYLFVICYGRCVQNLPSICRGGGWSGDVCLTLQHQSRKNRSRATDLKHTS